MKQSKEIIQFYKAIDDWVKSGFQGRVFSKGKALCSNSKMFADVNGLPTDSIKIEIEQQFVDAGLDSMFPFGESEFNSQVTHDTFYECPKRLAWIAARLADAEEQEGVRNDTR